jgi:hypothetical protein
MAGDAGHVASDGRRADTRPDVVLNPQSGQEIRRRIDTLFFKLDVEVDQLTMSLAD